jgi:hypothetical protein
MPTSTAGTVTAWPVSLPGLPWSSRVGSGDVQAVDGFSGPVDDTTYGNLYPVSPRQVVQVNINNPLNTQGGKILSVEIIVRAQYVQWLPIVNNQPSVNPNIIFPFTEATTGAMTTNTFGQAWTDHDLSFLAVQFWSINSEDGSAPSRVFSVRAIITYSLVPPVPVNVSPVNGATVNTDLATLGAYIGIGGNNQSSKAEWQLATNSAFTANLRQIDSDTFIANQFAAKVIPVQAALTTGIWFLRARQLDTYGIYSDWSTPQQFTVSHPPSASPVFPNAGQGVVAYGAGTVQYNWNYSDTSLVDPQASFEVVLESAATGTVIYDSGMIAGGSNTFNSPFVVPTAYKGQTLRWKVKVNNAGGESAGYSDYSTFTLNDIGIISSVVPNNGSVVSAQFVTISWNYFSPIGSAQANAFIQIIQTAPVPSPSIGDYQSGTVVATQVIGTQNFYIMGTNTTDLGLQNNTTYTMIINIQDVAGNYTLWQSTFTTSWVVPSSPAFLTVEA